MKKNSIKAIEFYEKGRKQQQIGKLQAAEKSYKKAIKINPNFGEAYNNLGNVLLDLGRHALALEAYKKTEKFFPNHPMVLNNIGNVLVKIGNNEEAVKFLKKSINISPEYADAYCNLGNAYKNLDKIMEALDAYNQAITLNPKLSEAHSNKGALLNEKGSLDDALKSLNKSIQLDPANAEAYNNLGNVFIELEKPEAALKSLNKSIQLDPANAEAYNNLGNVYLSLNDLNKANECYDKALAINPDYAECYRNQSLIKKYKPQDSQLKKMLTMYGDKSLSDKRRCHLCFAIAKAYEDLNELRYSFNFLKEGNSLRKSILGYEINKDFETFQALNLTSRLFKDLRFKMEVYPIPIVPIFILGMPRSGTTLIEQIISSHYDITAGGELPYILSFGSSMATGNSPTTKETVLEFRNKYIHELLQRREEGTHFITDKMPHNFMLIGLILSAIPEAKIIHVKRDPIAVCWSNYKHYFPTTALGYCYDIDDLKSFYKLYDELMSKWIDDYREKIIEIDYEKLTVNQEYETRELFKKLDISWDDNCLLPHKNIKHVRTASNVQVRKKVYSGSSLQWKKYEPYLDGAFDNFKIN